MRQTRTVLEFPRDEAYSRLYESRYIYPAAAQHNLNLVFEMFLAIDDSLTAAIIRELEN